jgi:hypothetical protein
MIPAFVDTISPQETSPMKQEMSVLGIAIAQRVFHAVGIAERGKIVLRQRLSRQALLPFIAPLPPVLIGLEACGGTHSWARRFRLAPTLTRHGYSLKVLAEWLNVRPAEIRSFLQGRLTASRAQELREEMLAAGIPL